MSVRDRLDKLMEFGMLDLPAKRSHQREGAPELHPFQRRETLRGVTWKHREFFAGDHTHGNIPVGSLLSHGTGALPLLTGGGEAPGDWGDLLFVDTETTGLSTGTGTYVFLVGLAYFTSGGVTVEQYLMPDPAEEEAFLIAVGERLDAFDHLASFNGKSFDVPLLSHRYTMNRMEAPLGFAGHCDLLHPARSLWRSLLPSCSLGSLEHHRLGVTRIDDVSGAEVPARYFLFLDDGDFNHLAAVVHHNTLDLLSSVTLAAHMIELAEGTRSPHETLALGKMARRAGDHDRANAYFADVLADPESLSSFFSAAGELSRWSKASKRWEEALNLWDRMIQRIEGSDLGLTIPPSPYVEMAKYYEHQARDYVSALRYAERAMSHVRRQHRMQLGSFEEMTELQHRVQRLQRKMKARSRT